MFTVHRLLEIALTNAGSAALLAIVAGLTQLWLRRPAIVRGLWLLVLLKLVTPPIFELGIPLPGPLAGPLTQVAEQLAQPATTSSGNPTFTANAIAGTASPPAISLDTVASGLWLLGAVAMAALAWIRTVRFQSALANAEAAEPALQDRVDELAISMGIGQPPRAVVVNNAISPMLWATPRTFRLIVPKGLLQQLNTREIDTLIAHELAHLRRRDHWVRYLELVAMVLFWWHPAAWWASRQLRRAEEECCDSLVAETLPEHRRAYADCLLKTMKYLARAGRAPYALDSGALATGAGEVQDLQRRLTMIIQRKSASVLSTPSRVVLTTLAVALLAVFPTIADSGSSDSAGASATVTQVNPRFEGEAIDFDPQGASLGDTLENLAVKTGLNIVINPDVNINTAVTTRFKEIPWDQVLSTVINNQALSYSIEGNMVWISGGESRGTNVNEVFEGSPISIDLDDADLRETLENFSEQVKLKIELEPGIEGNVSVHLKNVPWDQAFDAILRLNNLEYTVQDQVIKIHPASAR